MSRRAAILIAVAAIGVSVPLAGCSQGQAVDLARQACRHVTTSIRLFESAEQAKNPGNAAKLATEAHAQLLDALPIAAQANSEDGQWNALMTTISESARVSESHLIVALHAQCKLANSGQPYQGPAGGATSQPPTSISGSG